MSTVAAETPALDGTRRILWVSLSIAALVYTLLGWSKTASQLPVLEHWWAWGTYGIDTICPIALGVLAVVLPQRAVSVVAVVYALVFLGTMATWRLAMLTAHDPGAVSPWTNDIVTVAVVAAAIAAPPRWVWPYVVVATLLVGVVRYLADPELGVVLALMDMLYASLTNVVFAALTLVTRAGADRLDRAATRARLEAVGEASATARLHERARIDALMHDHVLSTLLVASRAEEGDEASRQRLRSVADTVLRMLADGPPDRVGAVSAEDLVAMLRAAVTSQRDGIDFRVRGSSRPVLPVDAARALVESTAEALRNSLRHAAREERVASPTDPGEGAGGQLLADAVDRSVTVSFAEAAVEVAVSDTGRGFVPRRVPVERLGLRVSIIGRMDAVPGGSASVRSAPGLGTDVVVGWRTP